MGKGNHIKNQVEELMKLHKTKDIHFLCNYYNINLLYGNFSVKGIFFIDENKYNFIFINNSLTEQEKINVLSHEFAHFVLHKKYILKHKAY